MQTDFYTKAILTVIALSLSVIALQNFLPIAHAQQGFRFTSDGSLLVSVDGLRISSNGILPVLICDRNLRNGNNLFCADVDDLKHR